jgi:hypothetical protein
MRSKKMKKILFSVLCVLLIGAAAFAADATLLGENTLRFTLAPAFGFQVQEWDWEKVPTDKAMFFNIGLGAEYGVTNWIGAELLWIPGVNAWSKIEGGKYGLFNDIYFGVKGGIMGPGALIPLDGMRFSAALGLLGPMPVVGDDVVREPDDHLWGTVLKLYYDYIPSPMFTLDVLLETAIYPNQYGSAPNWEEGMVKHYADIGFELEGRFTHPIEGKGFTIYWGIPVRMNLSPVMNDNDADAGELRYSLAPGLYFGMGFEKTPVPIEWYLKYSAPVIGLNDQPVHLVSLLGRVSIDLKK